MPLGHINIEWLALNAERSYPLLESASKVSTTGDFALPDSLILGLSFPIHWGLDVLTEKFFVQKIIIGGGGISISLGYDDGSLTPPEVASAAIALRTHIEYAVYNLAGVGDFQGSIGRIVLGKLDDLDALPVGEFHFTPAAGQLDVDCIHPMISTISSLIVANGSERSAPLTGDIVLTAGTNVRLSVSQVTGSSPVIRIDAVSGEGLNNSCECNDSSGVSLKTINGVEPDSFGNITLIGNDCLTIEPGTNSLKLDDVCSSPCCGCPELESITQRIEAFKEGRVTMENFVNRLNAESAEMSMTVLGAKLRDNGCFQ